MAFLEDLFPENNSSQSRLCKDHQCSLSVARTMRSFATERANRTARRRLFYDSLVGKVPWLPNGATLKVFTILRDPLERIRSKYYFQRSGWCVRKFGKECAAAQLTFFDWMNYTRNATAPKLKRAGSSDPKACCEYVDVLGGGDLAAALGALELFDVVAIAERMRDSVSEIKGAVGRKETNIAVAHHRNNADNKKAWTAEEKALATELTRKDRSIYEAALKRAESWGSDAGR